MTTMNTKIVAGAVALVVAAGAGYWLMRDRADVSPEEAEQVAQQEAGNRFTGSMRELAARGGSYRCEVAHETGADSGIDVASNGMVYVSGQKMRTDFSSMVEGRGEMESHMITDGQWMYTWSPSMGQGMKMRIDQTAAAPGQMPANQGSEADMDQTYSWDCEPWNEDASLFTPPSTVTFMELTMPAMPPMPAGMPQMAQ